MAKSTISVYYYRVDIHVEGSDESTRNLLKDAYGKQEKTYMYVPIQVRHKLYDVKSIREACNIVTRSEISVKKAIFPHFVKDTRLTAKFSLLLLEKNDANQKKRVNLLACRTNKGLQEIANNLSQIRTWSIDGISYSLARVVGPKEQIRQIIEKGEKTVVNSVETPSIGIGIVNVETTQEEGSGDR